MLDMNTKVELGLAAIAFTGVVAWRLSKILLPSKEEVTKRKKTGAVLETELVTAIEEIKVDMYSPPFDRTRQCRKQKSASLQFSRR